MRSSFDGRSRVRARPPGARHDVRGGRQESELRRDRRIAPTAATTTTAIARSSANCTSAGTASAACSSRRCAVDTETGVVKVERVVAVHDCGRPINPKLIESQIYGGVIQGVELRAVRGAPSRPGNWRAAQRQHRPVQDRRLARNRLRSKCTSSSNSAGQSSTDARGVAEPANVATAAAIANAFYNATGKRIRTLPMTPANVLGGAERPSDSDGASHAQLRMDRRDVGRRSRGAACRGRPRRPIVAKAGGMDLLDLMKEGIVRPARIVNLQIDPWARSDCGRRHRRPARWARWSTLARDRERRRSSPPLSGARGSRRARRDSAGAQCRDHRRQSAAAAALLVFPQRALPSEAPIARRPARRARTNTTRFSTTRRRRWCTPPRRRRRSSPTARSRPSQAKSASRARCRCRIFCCRRMPLATATRHRAATKC